MTYILVASKCETVSNAFWKTLKDFLIFLLPWEPINLRTDSTSKIPDYTNLNSSDKPQAWKLIDSDS